MTFGAACGSTDSSLGMLNSRMIEGLALRSDLDRMKWLLHASDDGIPLSGRLEEDSIPSTIRNLFPDSTLADLRLDFRAKARHHAESLDRRNGIRTTESNSARQLIERTALPGHFAGKAGFRLCFPDNAATNRTPSAHLESRSLKSWGRSVSTVHDPLVVASRSMLAW